MFLRGWGLAGDPQPFSFMCPVRLGYCTFDSLRTGAPPWTGVVTPEVSTKHFACEPFIIICSRASQEPRPDPKANPNQPQVFPNQVLTTNRISEVANRNLHGFGPRYPKN